MDGVLGTTTGPVRYRAATAVRPWIRWFLLLVLGGRKLPAGRLRGEAAPAFSR